MSEPKKEEFLDNIEDLEQKSEQEELIDIEEVASELDEIDAIRAERDEFRDKFMRTLADAENSRKRADKDRKEAEDYGGTRLSRDLLPIHDNLERAIEAAAEENGADPKALIEGVELTMRELLNVFRKHGIKTIAPEIGDKFDPKVHEAMFEAPLPNTKSGDIIQISTKGFILHDRLLRPAQVGVSSNPEQQ
ncbi:MAG: nucleotide exchange factor GrpE [Aestuariivita sp.]|nr:nucleotide exchange factor GrpE [Aestuariivita sp.]